MKLHIAYRLACVLAAVTVPCSSADAQIIRGTPGAAELRTEQLKKLRARRTGDVSRIAIGAAQAFKLAEPKRLDQLVTRGHGFFDFGDKRAYGFASAGLAKALEPLKAGFPDLQLRPTRVLANRKIVLVQGILSGTQTGRFLDIVPSNKSVAAETFQLHLVTEGQIRKSIMYVPTQILRTQLTAISGGGKAPALSRSRTYEMYTAPAIKLTKQMIPAIYRLAGLAVASRLAWLDGHPELMNPYLGELAVSSAAAKNVKGLRPYATAMKKSRISIETVTSSGPYLIAQLRFSGLHSAKLGSYVPTNRLVKLEVLSVARVASGKVERVQSYLDETSLIDQLRR